MKTECGRIVKLITNNTALEGGGLSLIGGAPQILRNRISGNQSCFAGAGIALRFASALIQRNIITGNTKPGCSGFVIGGGISVGFGSTAQILDNVISNNSSVIGGGIGLDSRSPQVNLIRGNLITGNSAFQGGGLAWLSLSPAVVINNTIADNDGLEGSGIYVEGVGGVNKAINNIVVAKPGQTAIVCRFVQPSIEPVFTFNNVFSPQGTAWGGECPDQTGINGNISADPRFVNPSAGDYHLQPNSPSIDAGNNSAQNLSDEDIDGDDRVIDGDGDGLAVVDMGVDEVVPSLFDICIQSGTRILRINLMTGGYQFTDCNGITLTGTGVLRGRGCTVTLQHNAPDRRIQAMVNTCQNRGTATVQVLSPRRVFNLSDSDIGDGCGCN